MVNQDDLPAIPIVYCWEVVRGGAFHSWVRQAWKLRGFLFVEEPGVVNPDLITLRVTSVK